MKPEDNTVEDNDNNHIKFAKKELNILLKRSDNDEMQKLINDDILQIVKIFSQQGHSGFSASYAINLLTRLLGFKPLTPLTGEDGEWNLVGGLVGEEIYQNNRCSAVFKGVDKKTGKTRYTYNDKYTISDNGGITWFTGGGVLDKLGLTNEIEMPFNVPNKPEYIYIKYLEDVPPGETSDNFVDITGNIEEIKKYREFCKKKFER